MHPPKPSLQTPPSQLESTLGLPPPNLHNLPPRHTYTYNKAWKNFKMLLLRFSKSWFRLKHYRWEGETETDQTASCQEPQSVLILASGQKLVMSLALSLTEVRNVFGSLSFQSSFFYISFPFSTTAWQVSTSYFLQWGLEPRKGIPSCSVILAWVGVMLAIKSFPINVTISPETSRFEFLSIVP